MTARDKPWTTPDHFDRHMSIHEFVPATKDETSIETSMSRSDNDCTCSYSLRNNSSLCRAYPCHNQIAA